MTESRRPSNSRECTATPMAMGASMTLRGRRVAITDPDALREELARTRERGYSLDLEENEEGVNCVGSPVLNHEAEVVAGISVAGPAFQLDSARLAELGALVRSTARRLSERLGREVATSES